MPKPDDGHFYGWNAFVGWYMDQNFEDDPETDDPSEGWDMWWDCWKAAYCEAMNA